MASSSDNIKDDLGDVLTINFNGNDDNLIEDAAAQNSSVENVSNALAQQCFISNVKDIYMDPDNNYQRQFNFEKVFEEFTTKIDAININIKEMNTQIALLKNCISDIPSIPTKHKKIRVNDNKISSPSIVQYAFKDYICVIKCNSDENFGQVIGRNGCNIKKIFKDCRVEVIVPSTVDSKIFPNIILLNHSSEVNNLDIALKRVLDFLVINQYDLTNHHINFTDYY